LKNENQSLIENFQARSGYHFSSKVWFIIFKQGLVENYF